MAKLAKISTVDSKSVDGLEDLLGTMDSVQGVVQSDDWKVEEVAEFLGLSTKTVRRRLKAGKLDGYLIEGANGPEWRVKQTTLDNVHGQSLSMDKPLSSVQGTVDNTVDKPTDTVLISELISKIEALTYRNGYLESQLTERERELKLLTELSTQKANRWSRFWQWFTNSR